ncbi:MAG: septum formation initiator family protein [Clostridia bacterium]|nr:septum formation initiator family protein [Clostridia bacterium]
MTYGNRPDYALADKMKSRFSGRGAAVSGMRASSTSELVRKAQMGGDPSENCSELDFRSGAGRQPANAQNSAPGYRPAYAYPAHAETSSRTANPTGTRTRPAEPQKKETPAPGAGRPASGAGKNVSGAVKNISGGTKNANRSGTHSPAQKNEKPAQNPRKKKNVKTTAKAKTKKKKTNTPKRPRPAFDGGEITEVRAEGRRMKPMSAVLIVIGTMMVMSIVLSFSEIYQTTSEIARLEADLAALRDQAAELELELEEKNDIRVIERIATEDLGMVKEDAVQRKYISLSDGERIDIIEDETAETDAAHGVLLSSIWSSLGSLFDYFR